MIFFIFLCDINGCIIIFPQVHLSMMNLDVYSEQQPKDVLLAKEGMTYSISASSENSKVGYYAITIHTFSKTALQYKHKLNIHSVFPEHLHLLFSCF